jgi:hypothetical protein
MFKSEGSSSGVGVGGVGVLGGAGICKLEAMAAAAGGLPEPQDIYYQGIGSVCPPSTLLIRKLPFWERRDLREAAAVISGNTPGGWSGSISIANQ